MSNEPAQPPVEVTLQFTPPVTREDLRREFQAILDRLDEDGN